MAPNDPKNAGGGGGSGLFTSLASLAVTKSVNGLVAYEGLEVINHVGSTDGAEEEASRGRWKQEAGSYDHLQLLNELVTRLNNQIQGFKAMVSELWYVEEFDLLALALGGRMKVRPFPLGCAKS